MNSALNPQDTPENKGKVFATVSETAAGCYISIYSMKAETWVRMLNRYGSVNAARQAIDNYGWTPHRVPNGTTKTHHAHNRPHMAPRYGR